MFNSGSFTGTVRGAIYCVGRFLAILKIHRCTVSPILRCKVSVKHASVGTACFCAEMKVQFCDGICHNLFFWKGYCCICVTHSDLVYPKVNAMLPPSQDWDYPGRVDTISEETHCPLTFAFLETCTACE